MLNGLANNLTLATSRWDLNDSEPSGEISGPLTPACYFWNKHLNVHFVDPPLWDRGKHPRDFPASPLSRARESGEKRCGKTRNPREIIFQVRPARTGPNKRNDIFAAPFLKRFVVLGRVCREGELFDNRQILVHTILLPKKKKKIIKEHVYFFQRVFRANSLI